ncbi:MAG: hypothetical protein JO369_01965 [Paucibacter sp.]|nr:hypothetical protein [Roseateles sp.]
MMMFVIGISNLLIGAAYVSLGLLSAWEAVTQYRYRGLSRFGLGFSLMAASCGPHHLVHGWCALHGAATSVPMLAVALLGLPAGLVFCWLRVEAMLGGQGDRTVAVTSHLVAAVTVSLLIVVGSLAGWSLAAPTPFSPDQAICTAWGLRSLAAPLRTGFDFSSPIVLTNLWVTVAYSMVGWYLMETQARRYSACRSWSMSGLALAAVFPSCAAMHLILALTHSADSATLPFDLLGVPASVYFLWVVKRLHMDSVVDWNRRPTVGVAGQPTRSSPWSE